MISSYELIPIQGYSTDGIFSSCTYNPNWFKMPQIAHLHSQFTNHLMPRPNEYILNVAVHKTKKHFLDLASSYLIGWPNSTSGSKSRDIFFYQFTWKSQVNEEPGWYSEHSFMF